MKLKNIIWSIFPFLFMSCFIKNSNISSSNNEIKYLALGDSYTIGESVNEKDRYAYQLVDLLKKAGKKISYPDIIAQTGWTTNELSKGIELAHNEKKYDIVSLAIGVNNQYRGQSKELYRVELVKLLETAIVFANNHPENVFMISIPDWGVTPFAANSNPKKIGEEIDLFNKVAYEECVKHKIKFIDITNISRKALNNKEMIAKDDLHFSGKMYKLWAQEIYNTFKFTF